MTHRLALFGHPVAHSRSPALHEAFAAATGRPIDFEWVDCEDAGFEHAVRRFAEHGGVGANVTLPHKPAAFRLATALSARARQAGAVNTLRFDADGILFGDNTDGVGLVADLTGNLGLDLAGQRVLVIGAGGAAQGIVAPLLECAPAELVIVNRTPGKAALLAARSVTLGRVRGGGLEEAGKAYDLVINASSSSLSGVLPAVSEQIFRSGTIAYDLYYSDDGRTAFTQWAKSHGAGAAVDGWGMLVEQAAESFHVWFGVRPETTQLYNSRQL